MKKTFFILFACLCSANAAQGAEPQDTGPVEISPLRVEQRVAAEDAVPPAGPVDVAEGAGIEGPAVPPAGSVDIAEGAGIEGPAVPPAGPVDIAEGAGIEGPAVPPAGPVDVAEGAGIEEPAPLGMTGGEVEAGVAEGGRDPFDVSAEQAMPSDYSLVAELVNLQGVVKMGDKQMGLFVVTKSRDEKVDFSKTVLRRVSIGERIRVYTRNVEYTFTLQGLGSRSAVIVGENDEAYDIML